MQFIPTKCETVHSSFTLTYLFCLLSTWSHTDQRLLSQVSGVTISSDLRCNPHIAQVTNKANCTLGFLQRNLRIGSRRVKEAYKALVRPQVEYASCVWDPYTQDLTKRLEMTQRRVVQYVCREAPHHGTTIPALCLTC